MLDREGHIKLMDFGLATTRRENLCWFWEPDTCHRGTSLRVGESYVRSICLGGLIYRMLYGCTPFDDENARNVSLTS